MFISPEYFSPNTVFETSVCNTEKVKIVSSQWNYKEASTLKGKYTHNFLGATERFKTDCSTTLGQGF